MNINANLNWLKVYKKYLVEVYNTYEMSVLAEMVLSNVPVHTALEGYKKSDFRFGFYGLELKFLM